MEIDERSSGDGTKVTLEMIVDKFCISVNEGVGRDFFTLETDDRKTAVEMFYHPYVYRREVRQDAA